MPRIAQLSCLISVPLSVLVGLVVSVASAAGSDSPSVKLYHADPSHLWNRVHEGLFVRQGPDKKYYGHDRLEPLLWTDSQHLITSESATKVLAVLDEFDRQRGETLIDDPLRRALLQRDLWLIANRAACSREPGAKPLLGKLARVIKRIALAPEQIAALPDNYAQVAGSKQFPAAFNPEHSDRRHLPPDLLEPAGPWVCLGPKDGPTAPLHTQASNPFNNSTFFVFLKFPAGREATRDFAHALAAFDEPLYVPNPKAATQRGFQHLPNPKLPQWPKGTAVAMVRRALLIDNAGRIVASPLTESVQFRVMRTDTPVLTVAALQALDGGLPGDIVNGHAAPGSPNRAVDAVAVAEFQFRRADLLAAQPIGLRDVSTERDFKTGFNAHGWDEFDRKPHPDDTRSFPTRAQPFLHNTASCIGCHRYPGIYSFNSFHSMFPFLLDRKLNQSGEDNEGNVPIRHKLLPRTLAQIEQAAIRFKATQPAWQALQKVLE